MPSNIVTRHTVLEQREARKGIFMWGQKNEEEPHRVLLVEDNIVNQKVAQRLLKKLNCRVDVAANGKEAVDLVTRFPYDLIFMDVQMPEMNGYEATAKIRKLQIEKRANIPIIAITANALEGDREKCLNAGMDDYLTKPVTPKKLQEALEKWGKKSPTHEEDSSVS